MVKLLYRLYYVQSMMICSWWRWPWASSECKLGMYDNFSQSTNILSPWYDTSSLFTRYMCVCRCILVYTTLSKLNFSLSFSVALLFSFVITFSYIFISSLSCPTMSASFIVVDVSVIHSCPTVLFFVVIRNGRSLQLNDDSWK